MNVKTNEESVQLFLEAQLVYMAGNSKTREVFLDIFRTLTEGKVTSFPAVFGSRVFRPLVNQPKKT